MVRPAVPAALTTRCGRRRPSFSVPRLHRGVHRPAAAAVPHEVIVGLLDRHAGRDWGDLDAEDRAANDSDHSHAEGRLFTSYDTPEHGTIWVITEGLRGEGDGPITTVLFPEDY